MLPAFVSSTLARQIVLAGKSIVFIRAHGGAIEELPGRSVMRAAIASPEHEGLVQAVDAAYRHASSRLLAFVRGPHQLMAHVQALRRYLLLGQGDLIRHLMDIMSPELAKPADAILKHQV